MPAAKTRPRAVGTKDLERYEELDEEIKRLRRQASDLAVERDAIVDDAEAWMRDAKPNDRTVTRCGFRLAIERVKNSVSWSKLFAEHHTAEEVEAARAEAGTHDRLKIERIKPKAG